MEMLLRGLREHHREWRDLERSDLEEMIRRSEKRRFEIRGSRIRALYGHSLPGRISKEPVEPPERLYHGTTPGAAEAIRREGIAFYRGGPTVWLSDPVPPEFIVLPPDGLPPASAPPPAPPDP